MPFVDPVIRSSIVLAIALVVSTCLAKRSAALRHRLLAAALLASVLVFPFSIALPEWPVTLPARAMAAPPAVATAPAESALVIVAAAPPQAPPVSRISIVWLTGLVIAAGTLITGIVRVRRAAARGRLVEDPRWLRILDAVARRYGLTRRIAIRRTDSAELLATWGLMRPQVLVPGHSRNWTEERVHVVLAHELAHIRRCDWLVQMCAETLRAILWFNPLVWMICRRLRCESEQACDDEVLALGVDGREYAAHLLELARQCRRERPGWASVIPMAQPSTLERRIAAMLNPQLNRRVPSPFAIAGVCIALVLIALPVAVLRARQVAPPSLTHADRVSAGESPQADSRPPKVVQAKPVVSSDAPPRIVRVTPRAAAGKRQVAPLTGTIYDVSGAVMPGVQVMLVDANDNTWTAASNASGRFELPSVSEGRYVLAVTLPGFRPLRQEFELRSSRDWTRAITLQVAELQETVTVRDTRVTAAESPSSSSNQPVRIGGNVRAPRKELDVRPIYPAAMRAAGLTGDVPIEAIIGRDGTVSSVRVLSAQVHPDFAIAAVDAVRQWRFTPTLLNGVPVEVVMRVSVRFDLD